MYSTLLTVALFVAPVFSAFAINNPELVQCETAQVSWARSEGPYNLIAVAANDPCGEPIADLGDFWTTIYDWQVNVPAGTIIQLSVADNGENESWTRNLTVGGGENTSCLGGASSAALPRPSQGASSRASSPSAPASVARGGASSSPSPSVAPVGAANAGRNGAINDVLNSSASKLSQPALAFGALAAAVAALAL